jgi:hypothetical protein
MLRPSPNGLFWARKTTETPRKDSRETIGSIFGANSGVNRCLRSGTEELGVNGKALNVEFFSGFLV